MLLESAIGVYQMALIVVLAPLLTGIIKKTKALFQTRKGPTVFQPYYDLYKFMQKESVISEHTSWIFRVTPLIYFSSMFVVSALVPVVSTQSGLAFTGDLILMVYLFALARFFLALAGLDAGSAFGGMGSSREMAVASVAEPALMLPLFTMAVVAGTTNLAGIVSGVVNGGGEGVLTLAHLMSFVAFFVVAVAETGRIPVDNPDTHLELTMIHEGMMLEYSGKNLALLTLSVSIKQLLIFTLLANVFFPWGIATSFALGALLSSTLLYILKIVVLGIAMAIIETSFSKMRLFKVPDLLLGSFVLGLLGLVSKFVFRG